MVASPVLVNPVRGIIKLEDALHQDAAVPFLLEVALKGPTPVPNNAMLTEMATKYTMAARCMAAALAGGYHGPDVLPVLAELLHSRNASLRACAATALYTTKTAEGAELLIEALSDADRIVRETSLNGLEDLTDQSFGEDKEAWLKWWQEHKLEWPFNDRFPGTKRYPQKWVPAPARPPDRSLFEENREEWLRQFEKIKHGSPK